MTNLGSVLITGGAGFFGRTFARMLLEGGFSDRICIYSRDEYKHALQRADYLWQDQDKLRWFIGDVRDPDRLRQAFEGVDTVVHAAALKRIEVGQYNPTELVKTNIIGSMNVIDAATAAGVGKVIALSTDKAYQPVSPYGQSKALAESLFLNANHTRGRNGPIFAAVRYGNVAGSTGSIIPTWRRILSSSPDGKVPVTDPGCTRFWMTVDEAAHLVLDLAQIMRGGELIIPTLPAYDLHTLADAMGAKGFDIIGLPAHEKKHESMDEHQSSDLARRMGVTELRDNLKHV